MWEISVNNQAASFLLSMPVGIILSILYDFFYAIRAIKKPRFVAVFILDIIYFIIAAFVVFCFFLLRTNGEIRAFCLVGILLGFIFSRQTITKLFIILSKPFLKICKIFKKYLKIILKPLASFKKFVYNHHIKIKRKIKTCNQKKSHEKASS